MHKITDLRVPLTGYGHDPQAMRLISRRPLDGDQLTVTGRLAETGHDIRMVVEHRQGAYRVVSVTVDAPDGGEVTSALLGIAVKEAMTEVLAQAWSMFRVVGESEDDVLDPDELRADFLRKQRRRTIDDTHLRRVAEIYKVAESAGEPTIEAVRKEFYVSPATAERYIRAARDREFLPPSRRKRKAK